MIKYDIEDNLVHIYSDCGNKLIQVETGIIYSEVVQSINSKFTYIEDEEDQ